MTPENNIFGKDGFFWWVGVVEDRMDPLKLGRCRVRILGYHLDNKQILPTEDLPWSIPVQPITSAAISGKGSSPIGPLEGTWVIGFFADGKDCQQPVMIGTLAGYPKAGAACPSNAETSLEEQPGVVKDSAGNVVKDETGKPILAQSSNTVTTATDSNAIASTLPPLTQSDIQSLMDAIGKKESSSVPGGAQNYSVTNRLGYVGKYQFGAAALQSLGYVRNPVPMKARSNSELTDASVWTGKNGISSLEDWKQNRNNCQETAMFELLKYNYKLLTPSTIDPTGEKGQAAGYLAVAHLLGAGGARNLKNGSIGKDANGASATQYYDIGAAAVGGEPKASVEPPPDLARRPNTRQAGPGADPAGPLNDPKLGQPEPYSDPNSVYPRCEYTDRADTNKLATNDADNSLVNKKKQNAPGDINIANTAETWTEPAPAYCARYPYNHVIESESGHVIEMDDTPGAERLHIWHRTGTYIEIDRDGTLRQHVQGDNYEVFIRNNRMYTKGNWDLTVDGPAKVMLKDAADVEIWGKTVVNIKNDADVNVAGDLKFKAANIYMEATNDIQVKAGNYYNLKTGGDANFVVGGDEQHEVAGDYDLDASNVNINSGTANATDAASTGLDTLTAQSPSGGYPEYLVLPECSAEESAGYQQDAGEDEQYANKMVNKGVYTQPQVEQGKAVAAAGCKRSDTNRINVVTPVRVDVSEFENFTDFPDTIKLSKYFTLGEVSNRVALASEQKAVVAQRGLTKKQIVSNLKALAVNVLDPIRAKYPNMFVTNAFRVGSGSSQHELGEAADLQFRGATASEYYDIALWIRDNVAYDQLLLEYKTTGSGQPWIHVSHKISGNRAATASNKVMTFMNHASVKPFLCDLSS